MQKSSVLLLFLAIIISYSYGFLEGIRVACKADGHERKQMARRRGWSEEYSSK